MTAIREALSFLPTSRQHGLHEALGNAEASGMGTQTVGQISEAVLESGGQSSRPWATA